MAAGTRGTAVARLVAAVVLTAAIALGLRALAGAYAPDRLADARGVETADNLLDVSFGQPESARIEPADATVWVDVMPQVVHRTVPRYPRRARAANVEGFVVTQVLIETTGRVSEARLVRSDPMFDAAALGAVRKWVFTPALTKEGKPVRVWVSIPMSFRLH